MYTFQDVVNALEEHEQQYGAMARITRGTESVILSALEVCVKLNRVHYVEHGEFLQDSIDRTMKQYEWFKSIKERPSS